MSVSLWFKETVSRVWRRCPHPARSAAIVLALALVSGCCAATSGLLPADADAATQAEAIVNAAASQAGRPYCFDGGNTGGPTHGVGGAGCEGGTVGFDCTGLTLFAVYQATGRVLSHDGHQASEGGQIIGNVSELQPGDLVFFGGSLGNFEHAGVYAGGGKIWDALNYGLPVQLHTLSQVGLPFVGGARYGSGSASIGEGSVVSHNGFVYRIAGGAPIYVSNWAAIGGPQAATPLSDGEFAALRQFPRDGTILDSSGGGVFIAAGGAPLFLSNWAAIGGSKPGIGIDQAAIDNAGSGVPWDHLRAYPADGTFLNTSAGHVYRVAGGTPIPVTAWSIFGGVQPYVTMDQWDVDHESNPAAHLRSTPLDGTLVRGLPSSQLWSFGSGLRSPAAASAQAVAVDDAGLSAFPIRSLPALAADRPRVTPAGHSGTCGAVTPPLAPGMHEEYTFFKVVASHLPCHRARKIAHMYLNRVNASGNLIPRRIHHFACTVHRRGSLIRCRHGEEIVLGYNGGV